MEHTLRGRHPGRHAGARTLRQRITAHRLKALGLVDKIVNEPVGGAQLGDVDPGERGDPRPAEERGELGGAVCVVVAGEVVVDLWGGLRNEATGEPWEEDTMVLVFSATKGGPIFVSPSMCPVGN